MSERLTVTITAADGASKTFVAVGNSAKTMGNAVEQAGQKGEQSLKEMDTAAKTSGKSMDDLKNKATAVGAAVGVMGTAIIALGSAHRDEQRQIDGIIRLYGDQADAILENSEHIQDFTRYSNDAARESYLLASSLVGNYELSTEQLTLLVERSADLAQIYGFTLPDAVQRTSAALRGEGESAERLGLNMSDAAIAAAALEAGITNWNVPGALTEAEKAAFRFQVFMEQSATASGAAAEAADNAGGRFRQFANDMQDAGQRLGGFLGPIGEVGAEMAPLVIALPVVTAGLGRLSTSLGQTAVAGRAATLALSPLGGAVAAITVALGAGYLAWNIYQRATEEGTDALAEFVELAEQARLSGDDSLAEQFERAEEGADAFRDTVNKIRQENTGPNGFANLPIMPPGDHVEAWNSMVNTIKQNLQDTRVDQEAYLTWVEQQWAFATAILNNPQLLAANPNIVVETIERINNVDMSQFRAEVDQSALSLLALSQAAAIAGAGLDSVRSDAERAGDTFLNALVSGAEAAIEAHNEYIAALDNLNNGFTTFLSNGDNILAFWLQYETLANQGAASFQGTEQEYQRWLEAMEQEAEFKALVQLAEDLDNAGEALDQVLATFDRIDSLGQRSAAAGSIVDNLIGDPGELAVIDDLLESGRISIEEYNAALASGAVIQQSNLNIQEDLNAMRVAQLPLLESELQAYEAQIDAISQLPALEQRRALAMQDSAVQAQIATQYATAYSATIGEIPPEVATNMIVSAAEADPVLKDLLLQFGLIEEGADGTISVNFPDGPTVQESIASLTDSIDALTIAMGGVPPLRIEAEDNATPVIASAWDYLDSINGATSTTYVEGQDNASSVMDGVRAGLNALNGATATVSVFALDMASGVLGGALNMLNALDGRTATTYVRTVGLSQTASRHGGVPGFALGGTVVPFIGGEAGPEVAHFANGGSAILPAHAMYAAPPMTYISPANANPGVGHGGLTLQINAPIYGNVYGVDDLAAEIMAPVADMLQDEVSRTMVAAGVM